MRDWHEYLKTQEIKVVAIGDIKPYANNPRLNEAAVPAVAASIRRFGFRNPILVDADGVIIEGHTRRQSHRADNTQAAPARCTPTHLTTGSATARQLPTWSGQEQPARAPASFLQSTLPKRRGLCPGCSQLHPKD